MTIRIKLVEKQEVQEVLKITNQEATRSLATASYRDEPLERWEEMWMKENTQYPWLIAVKEGNHRNVVLGYAKASPFNPRDGFLWSVNLSIYLCPEVRGQGLSTRLYENLFSVLRAQNFRNVYAQIALPNPLSIRLHEHFGLKQTGVLPQFSWKNEHWYDLAILTGQLNDSNRAPQPLKKVQEVWELNQQGK